MDNVETDAAPLSVNIKSSKFANKFCVVHGPQVIQTPTFLSYMWQYLYTVLVDYD